MITTRTSTIERGEGQPLVFLHGIGGNAETWHYQLEELREDYHVVALDLPGYGGTSSLPQMTFPALADWLNKTLLNLEIENSVLIGNSFGGMIVQEYLATFSGQAKAAVLYGTSPAFGRKDGEWQQKFIRARLQPLDEGKTMAELAPKIVQGVIGSGAQAEGIALAEKGVADVPAETFRAAVHCLVEFDQRANLAKIEIPCLVLVGAEDTNAPPPMMEKMASKIPGAVYRTMPGLGHIAHIEDGAQFNRVIVDFLQQL
ncbi:alpha/beta hydrolase [Chloroflexi bacterium TSY]|nr:alpha/beta hydrolase [Chloroflexi bacterium TSY]